MLAQSPAPAYAKGASSDNRYGGPIYMGPPDLVTAGAFISAGGGPAVFSARTALATIIGVQLVDPEIAVLQTKYGAAAVGSWLRTFDLVIRDAAAQANAAGYVLPLSSPAHTGKALFIDLMRDGTDPGGTFWTGHMLDRLVTHAIHTQTMSNIDASLGEVADAGYHKITSRFVYDVAVQLGLGDNVKLAPDH